MRIYDLEFSCRVANCLDAEGIETVDDLCKRSERDLLRITNFGPTSLREVRSKLATIGRALGSGLTVPPPPKRYGIIPCRRCAFYRPSNGETYGKCHRNSPPFGIEYAHFPTMHEKSGCGDGLLREEAAPLPPEQQEPKP